MSDYVKILTTMIGIQESMNSHIHPQWREQGWNFWRAAWMECAELMDHIGWKWWSKEEPRMDQARVEVVDIWHFVLSSSMVHDDLGSDLDSIHHFVSQLNAGIVLVHGPNDDGDRSLLRHVDSLARHLAYAAITNAASQGITSLVLNELGMVMQLMDMTMDDVYRTYTAKAALNIFRQKHGYKTGEYSKVWSDGREDNEHLQDVINRLPISHGREYLDAVTVALEDEYDRWDLTKAVR